MTTVIPAHIRDRCIQLGNGALYAVKVLGRQLQDDPQLGEPTGDLALYSVSIDGEAFDDCPPLTVLYAYGPPLLDEGQLQIREVIATGPTPAADSASAPALIPDSDPELERLAARQVTKAWQRITAWLEQNAPASYAALLPAAAEGDIAALEHDMGVRAPVELRTLWLLCAGSQDTAAACFLPDGGWALMPLGSAGRVYRWQSQWQQQNGDAESPLWKPAWIPFCSWSVTDTSYGRFIDAETGEVGHWDDMGVRTVEDVSLTMFLEEIADTLENPQLATGYRPGLIGERLVWGPPLAQDEADLWQPWTG
ncbi:SMI1/KNR4 family protein [Streptomyces sp. NPDC057696]|uniref:SMI1/KNR4 family protein n=1 Tax=Streptomyces sp. NPDC057696 TaxID=3346218 RepID=UPI00368172BC